MPKFSHSGQRTTTLSHYVRIGHSNFSPTSSSTCASSFLQPKQPKQPAKHRVNSTANHLPSKSVTFPVIAMSDNLKLAAQFLSKRALQQACSERAISHHFELVPVRLNKEYYTVECKGDGCPWRLYAARIKKSEVWQIKTFTDEHTCHGLNKSKNKQANAGYVTNHILEKLRE